VDREGRIGLNEAVFREFNERLEEVARGFELRALDLVCECANADCTDRITMAIAEYEQLRSDPRQFALVPGHELPELEEIVARRDDYVIALKRVGEPAEVAEATDPRSS
jgi:hypothetical protein